MPGLIGNGHRKVDDVGATDLHPHTRNFFSPLILSTRADEESYVPRLRKLSIAQAGCGCYRS